MLIANFVGGARKSSPKKKNKREREKRAKCLTNTYATILFIFPFVGSVHQPIYKYFFFVSHQPIPLMAS